jgi:hypothetical protein
MHLDDKKMTWLIIKGSILPLYFINAMLFPEGKQTEK